MRLFEPDYPDSRSRSRRWFLGFGAAWSAALAACRSKSGATSAADARALGSPVSAYGARSRFEHAQRYFQTDTRAPLEEASSRTPLHETYGIITPSCCISNVIILPYRRRTGRPASRFVPSKGIRSGGSYPGGKAT